MRFYDIPGNYQGELEAFAEAIRAFAAGRLHPAKFRAIRVPFGVYEQRTKGTFMVRIRMTAGGVTPGQLAKVAELAATFGKPAVHVTTRQELQLHDIMLEDIPEILRELDGVGLSSRGGGGNTVRNIMASCDSGINPEESFDVTPHAVALTSRLIGESDSWNFPRKFKISFSSTLRDNALAAFNDLGFIATQKGDNASVARGFKVFVAGGMGCRPRLAKVLHDFLEEDRVYHVSAAVKNLFLEYGNRKTKNSGRLRFLLEEMGEEAFFARYEEELARVADRPPLALDFSSFGNRLPESSVLQSGYATKAFAGAHFAAWQAQYVTDQRQAGAKSVLIPLKLGDLRAEDGLRLARFLARFGENVMRLTMTQNILVRNLPEQFLGNLYELVTEMDTISHLPRLCGEIIACTGANTCTTGVCLPQGLVPVIQKFLTNSGLNFKICNKLRINISGCPNSCGQHHVGDLGFYGRIARKNGRTFPAYWVVGGAEVDPDTRAFGEKCGWVAARDLPQLLVDILAHYQTSSGEGGTFKEYFDRGGRSEIENLCRKYSEAVPDYGVDPGYYVDWGATEEFTTAHMGHGECSAGIYDMIEVAMNTIRETIGLMEKGGVDRAELAGALVASSAGMLLVTRGVDPADEKEMYLEFDKHFIATGLVAAHYRPLVEAALRRDAGLLAAHLELAADLGRDMIRLYHSMDNRLRFTCEVETKVRPAAVEQIQDAEVFKDLRGVACPMNFVKTKVELSRMAVGGRLRILLDDGEPADNVPRSVRTEGHEILAQERLGDHWQVVIEKKV